jgi:hypothetical protein
MKVMVIKQSIDTTTQINKSRITQIIFPFYSILKCKQVGCDIIILWCLHATNNGLWTLKLQLELIRDSWEDLQNTWNIKQ